MARLEITVTVVNSYKFERPSFVKWQVSETRYIHTFKGEDGKTYVWKTTTPLGFDIEVGKHEDKTFLEWQPVHKGDVIRIRATVKAETEYKGEPQTEINRVKVVERTFKAKTPDEIKEDKKAEQLASITEEDLVWTMPYRQYKEHYSDCETLIDSFTRHRSGANTITVIIRAGRLKESGVRGKRFSNYEFTFCVDGESMSDRFYAVSVENAVKQLTKKYKNATAIMEAYHY